VATPSQFVHSPAHDLFQRTLATGQQSYGNLALVAPAAVAADIAVRLKPIDQAHGTVVPDKQALCELSYGRFVLSRKCADRKKHLILLWFKAGPFGSSVATSKKLTDAIPQFSQCGVFRLADSFSHVFIISQYDINASTPNFEAS
jgi:hypothetical protein